MYRNEVNEFVDWRKGNYLELNVKKTKEMIVDFRKKTMPINCLKINDENVETVHKYKYLGTVIDDKLTGSDNIQLAYSKAIQRIHCLRVLNNLKIDRVILTLFYRSVIESVICFCISCWYGNAKQNDKNKLCKIIRIANKMGVSTTSLPLLYDSAVSKLTQKIMKDSSHPLYNNYVMLCSGRRLNIQSVRTNRLRNSFVPHSIKLYNYNSKK
jgi:hypothetical protein